MVITVVAILVAVLLPVFRKVEGVSRSAVCASNFHQVGLASLMYTADYDDRFMPIGDLPERVRDTETAHSWVQILLPYTTKSFAIFHCPADQTGPIDLSTFDQDLIPGDSDAEPLAGAATGLQDLDGALAPIRALARSLAGVT